MKSLLFNFNSVEISYGDNVLTSVIQINERIDEISANLSYHEQFNDFERKEMEDRLNKLVEWNKIVQRELEAQVQKLEDIKANLNAVMKVN